MLQDTVNLMTENGAGLANATVDIGNRKGIEVIKVEIQVDVPESLDEAYEFFGGEEETLKVLRQEVKRRRANAARPVLRDAEEELDWEAVALQYANSYTPGRKGGFAPRVSEDELEGMESDDIIEYLRRRGLVS